jgi:hypothetical protein
MTALRPDDMTSPNTQAVQRSPGLLPFAEIALSALLAAIALLLFVYFFAQLPIEGTLLGVDWKSFHESLAGGDLQYFERGKLRVPPWSMIPLLPLGHLSFRVSWAVITFCTCAVMILSVPRSSVRWRYLTALVLVTTCFPVLRHINDGNVEWLVILGVLIASYAYDQSLRQPKLLAIGVLLALTKPQEMILLLPVMALFIIAQFPVRHWGISALIVALIIAATMLWRGEGWLGAVFGRNYAHYTGGLLDISLSGTLTRLGLPPIVTGSAIILVTLISLVSAWRARYALSRELLGLLIIGSILISPYTTDYSVVTPIAIALTTFYLKRPLMGLILFGFVNAPFFMTRDFLWYNQATYYTGVMALLWLALALALHRDQAK